MEGYNGSKKRVRDEFEDSLDDVPASKSGFKSVDPCSSELEHSTIDLSKAEEIQDDLLDILEDSDAVTERYESIEGLELDSFIKSFEEEIQNQSPSKMTALDQNNESPQLELGYLFEASDDELGLPPTTDGSNIEEKIEANDFTACCNGSFEIEGNLGFEDEIPCYDSLEIGIGGVGSGEMCTTEENGFGFGGEFALFDYSDVQFRPESLPAL